MRTTAFELYRDMVSEVNTKASIKIWVILILIMLGLGYFYNNNYESPSEMIRYTNSYFENRYLEEAAKRGIKLTKEPSGFFSHYGENKKVVSEIQKLISEEQESVLTYIFDVDYARRVEVELEDASIWYRAEYSVNYETGDEPEKNVVLLFVNSEDKSKAMNVIKGAKHQFYK